LYFATNIKFLRERKRLSQEQLSSCLKMTRAKVAAYEINHTKNPALKDLESLSQYFSISIDALLKLDLAKLPDPKLKELEDGKLTGADLRVVVTTVTNENKELIEYVPVKARAGYLSGYADPDFISGLPTVALPNLPRGRKYRMFALQGDSMLPIPDGALVVGEYMDDWKAIKTGELCIVVTASEGIVFKELENNIVNDRSVTLQSLNAVYAPYTLPVGDIIEIWKYKCYVSESVPVVEDCSIQTVFEEIKGIKAEIRTISKKINK
jgi:transcriptional regulator with XRE-family HTH domain